MSAARDIALRNSSRNTSKGLFVIATSPPSSTRGFCQGERIIPQLLAAVNKINN